MNAQPLATRLVLYARKSNDREDRQVRSLGDQVKLAEEEAAKLGISIVHKIVESKSAKRPGTRPGFQEMIEYIEAGKADGILCWHPDRLARNSVDGGWVVDLLDRGLAKDLYFLSYHFSNSPEGKMALGMVFSQAKYMVDKLSIDVSRGMAEMRAEGGWGSFAPEGYKNVRFDDGKKAVVPDPERFPLLRRAVELILDEVFTVAEVRRHLNSWGYQRRSTKERPGGPMAEGAWYRILANPFYMGMCRHKDSLYPGSHQPLMSAAEYAKLQKLIGRKDILVYRKHTYAYARGLFTCASCGCQITATLSKGRHQRGAWIYYHCTNRKGICDKRGTREDVLEEVFQRELAQLTIPEELLPTLKEIAAQALQVESKAKDTTTGSVSKRLSDAKAERTRLVQLLAKEIIAPEDFTPAKRQLDQEIAELEGQAVTSATRTTTEEETVQNTLSFAIHALNAFENAGPDAKRRIVHLMSSSRVLTPGEPLLEPHPYLQGFRELHSQIETFKPLEISSHITKIPPVREVLSFGRPNEYRNKADTLDTNTPTMMEISEPVLMACRIVIDKLIKKIQDSGEYFPELPLK
jgi:DNA invertase Pin-like site-specific DNA recombinase